MLDLHMGTVATLTSLYNVPLFTSVDVMALMKTTGVVKNSGNCVYSIGLIFLTLSFAVSFSVLYIYICTHSSNVYHNL